jgi:ABC-type Zn2+ transport system substrate-binding protein/surface adhesin
MNMKLFALLSLGALLLAKPVVAIAEGHDATHEEKGTHKDGKEDGHDHDHDDDHDHDHEEGAH